MIACVTECAAMKSVSSGPATRDSSGTITTREPVQSAIDNSKTATSNPIDANCITTEPGTSFIRCSAVATRLEIPS